MNKGWLLKVKFSVVLLQILDCYNTDQPKKTKTQPSESKKKMTAAHCGGFTKEPRWGKLKVKKLLVEMEKFVGL
ncbi:hypothetical protein E3N88_06774 [Mikania micrantha]|uniref:Uncharacterized protein n=1 Tax=Mikania micrantha TaxID=192012 RepID=A0A5N6PPQ1_9ASTR|nr:hypothetical protein E3N88_06774 [Mikania micrantha]